MSSASGPWSRPVLRCPALHPDRPRPEQCANARGHEGRHALEDGAGWPRAPSAPHDHAEVRVAMARAHRRRIKDYRTRTGAGLVELLLDCGHGILADSSLTRASDALGRAHVGGYVGCLACGPADQPAARLPPQPLPPPGNNANGRCINCDGTGSVDWDGTGSAPSTCPDCQGAGRVMTAARCGGTRRIVFGSTPTGCPGCSDCRLAG